ncbi:MAG TPA: 4-oxalomesaconate tautomerase [Hyphomicrobiaceae bacterium]|nr:4-oxalomesaconate tautomerase [Hyphomicrobiaceae bacterium]
MPQRAIPCIFMRGGTSRGPYFRLADLPADRATRDRVLLAAMGSPDVRQIDGLGGADPLTSKVAMVGPSKRKGIDVDYHFAQVLIDKAIVDTSPPCGNMLSGVAPFAIERGMVRAVDPVTLVRIYDVNTDTEIEATVQTPGGRVEYAGDTAIDGVPGTAAPINLDLLNAVGSKTGKLLPTGQVRDVIDGIEVTMIDVAMPMVIARADAFGLTGYEGREHFAADKGFFARMEPLRRKAGLMMGLGDVSNKVIPKFGILAAPRHGGTITSRYFVPDKLHQAHAVTGGACVAACCVLPGSVADGLARIKGTDTETIVIEHPSGILEIRLVLSGRGTGMKVERAGIVRTARKIMAGEVFVPESVWPLEKTEPTLASAA